MEQLKELINEHDFLKPFSAGKRDTEIRGIEIRDDLAWSTEELMSSFNFKCEMRQDRRRCIYYEKETSFFMSNVDIPELTKPMSIKHERLNTLYEMVADCLVNETASSSPSMILHQIISATLIDLFEGSFRFEEQLGYGRPDLLWENLHYGVIYIDVTSENMSYKAAKYEKDYPGFKYLIVNKYAFNFNIEELKWLRVLSADCDKRANKVMFSLIERQGKQLNQEMLYTQKLLDYFSNSDALTDDEDVLLEALESFLKQDKDLLNEKYDEILNDVRTKLIDKSNEVDSDRRSVRHHYCFPDSDILKESEVSLRQLLELSKPVHLSGHNPNYVDELGTLSYVHSEGEKVDYFEKKDNVRVHVKSKESYSKYPAERINRKLCDRNRLLALLPRFGSVTRVYDYLVSRLDKRILDTEYIVPQSKDYNHLIGIESSSWTVSDQETLAYKFHLAPDPDHLSIMKDRDVSFKSISFLSKNRDYFETRFKRKIVSAIKMCHKDGSKIKVLHWDNLKLHAEVYVSGLLFSQEKGVAYVSYFMNDNLFRTELWRLSDVENYETASERMFALLLATERYSSKYESYYQFLTISFRLINENSWGASRWLKPLRYFTMGICMKSSLVLKALGKVLKEMKPEDMNRLSAIMIWDLLGSNAEENKIEYYKTPIFMMEFTEIGYEAFMYDLCPRKTYGRKKHLKETMFDLLDEVELYEKCFDSIKLIYKDFEEIIDLDQPERNERLVDHLRMIENHSEKTGQRFTFSPAAIVMISSKFEEILTKNKLYQGSVLPLFELCTAKASHSTVANRVSTAAEAISELSSFYKSGSTSRIGIKIVNRVVDLTMRVFDKPQVGGNREISILTGQFRILQSILEQYARKLAENSSIDILDRPDKFSILANSFSDSFESDGRIMLTADQTRWGPNFSTVVFGLMFCYSSRFTTEYYMPTLACLLSEFKIFEMPVWIPELFAMSNSLYSVPGLLARSHMGQGIFHRSSSLFHSLVLGVFLDVIESKMEDDGIKPDEMVKQAFCTSDDVALTCYLSKIRTYEKTDEEILKSCRASMSLMPSFLPFFSIKTSDYKNELSDRHIEMNSIMFGFEGLGANDLKFISSLIEAGTSGNFLRDIQQPFYAHDSCINSGCDDVTAESVFYGNYLLRARQWRLNLDQVGIPIRERIRVGLPSFTQQDEDKMKWVYFKTNNNFKLRNNLKKVDFDDASDMLVKLNLQTNLESISNSIAQSAYKNMIVRFKESEKRITPLNPVLNDTGIFSVTYESFLRMSLEDLNFSSRLAQAVGQPCMLMMGTQKKKDLRKFSSVKVKKSLLDDFDPLTFALSIIDNVHKLKSNFTKEEFISHIYRYRGRYQKDEIAKSMIKSDSFEDAFISAKTLLNDFSLSGGSVRKLIHSKEDRTFRYQQLVLMPSGLPLTYGNQKSFKAGVPSVPINFRARYMSSASTIITYARLNGVNLSFDEMPKNFTNLPPSLSPMFSDLRYFIDQVDGLALEPMNAVEYAMYEALYQNINGDMPFVDGKPISSFLNYQITAGKEEDVVFSLDEDKVLNMMEQDGMTEDVKSAITSQVSQVKIMPRVEKKTLAENEAILEMMMREHIKPEMQRAILETFNMAVRDVDEEIKQGVTVLYKRDLEEEETDDFVDMFSRFTKKKKMLVEKSVSIDWRYILCGNTFSLKRILYFYYVQRLRENGVIYTPSNNDIMEVMRTQSPILYLDKNLPKKLNELVNISYAQTMTKMKKNPSLYYIRNADLKLPFSVLGHMPLGLSVTGRPKHKLVSFSDFESDYDAGLIHFG